MHGVQGCMHGCKYACMDAWMHAWMHPCIHAWMHGCMHGCIHACMHPCIHASGHACMDASMHRCIHAWMHACMDASTPLTSRTTKRLATRIWFLGSKIMTPHPTPPFDLFSNSVCSMQQAGPFRERRLQVETYSCIGQKMQPLLSGIHDSCMCIICDSVHCTNM